MQGKSAGEECPIWVLNTLLNEGSLSFEELVEKGKVPFSRGTINKYLGKEFEEGHVDREGRRGKYFITPKGKQRLFDFSTVNLEKANRQWLQTAVKLVQEGHARILTNKELERMKMQSHDSSKLVVEVDDKGLIDLGISEGQIMAIEITKQAAKNLRKEGYNIINLVQGKNAIYGIERK